MRRHEYILVRLFLVTSKLKCVHSCANLSVHRKFAWSLFVLCACWNTQVFLTSVPPQIRRLASFALRASCTLFILLFCLNVSIARITQSITSIENTKWHSCESAIVNKRPTLVFRENVSYWRVCLPETCDYYFISRHCNSVCIKATNSALLHMLTGFQNQSYDARDVTKLHCNEFQSEPFRFVLSVEHHCLQLEILQQSTKVPYDAAEPITSVPSCLNQIS